MGVSKTKRQKDLTTITIDTLRVLRKTLDQLSLALEHCHCFCLELGDSLPSSGHWQQHQLYGQQRKLLTKHSSSDIQVFSIQLKRQSTLLAEVRCGSPGVCFHFGLNQPCQYEFTKYEFATLHHYCEYFQGQVMQKIWQSIQSSLSDSAPNCRQIEIYTESHTLLETLLLNSPGGVTNFLPESPPPLVEITPKEREVFDLLVKGCTYKQIAQSLNKAPSTINKQACEVYKKHGVKNKIELKNLCQHSGGQA